VTGAGQQDVLQIVFRQVHRARRADQDAVLAEQAWLARSGDQAEFSPSSLWREIPYIN
jgi:hypothetical protein